ncbi:MAG: flagellar export chaperone FlgN [Pseudomonadota bacterium]
MTDNSTDRTVGEVFSALDDCLEREKTALLTGDLDAISALMDEKSELISQLNALGATEDHALDTLKDKAERRKYLTHGSVSRIIGHSASPSLL